MPTVTRVSLLQEYTAAFISRQDPSLSEPPWIKLRYESIWGMNREGKMQYPIRKITKMDKFNAEDMWLGLLHIFG